MIPCPFCGGKAVIINRSDRYHNKYYPSCADRNCIGRNLHKYFPTEQKAVTEWNDRKP